MSGEVVISRASDVEFVTERTEVVHFRKFVSKRLWREVLKRAPNLKVVSFSRTAWKRVRFDLDGMEVRIRKHRGRRNLMERLP